MALMLISAGLWLWCMQIKAVVHVAKPCTNLTQMDSKFMYKNLVHLHKYSKSYFSNPVVRECNINFIDLARIEPPQLSSSSKAAPAEDRSYIWISYAGDSLSRELFVGAVQRFTGYAARALPEDFDMQRFTPLLGGHMGPDREADIGQYKMTYHQPKLVCCKLPNENQKIINHKNLTDPCLFALGADSVDRISKNALKIFRKYRFYLFNNVTTYIRDVVDPLFMGQFRCLSFAWTPRFTDGVEYVREVHSVEGIKPSAIIMNMALHEHTDSDRGLDNLIEETNKVYDSYGTYFIMHSGTFVNDTIQATYPNSSVMEKHVKYIDGLVRRRLLDWRAVGGRYLNLHELSHNLHKAKCATQDGIHLKSKCNYQAFVIQWDFNWLNYGHVIKTQKNVLNWTEEDDQNGGNNRVLHKEQNKDSKSDEKKRDNEDSYNDTESDAYTESGPITMVNNPSVIPLPSLPTVKLKSEF